MQFLSKYGVARHIYIPIIKRAVVDFAVSADWTPAAGDVKISKDGGAAANVTNLPTAITMGNTAMWDFSITATEMQAAQILITIADASTKAVEDTMFVIETYGNASAQHAVDLSDSVRAGLTALPNAAAEAAGGLYTRGSGAGQINQPANGQIDANTVKVAGTVQTAGDLAAMITTVDDFVDTEVSAIKAKTDQLTFTAANKVDCTIQAAGDFAQGAADKVWASGTRTLTSFGTLIQDIWDKATSALTTAGSIGKLLVDNINATISSRLASASYTAPDNAGIAAIKAKTDQLAFTIANKVDSSIQAAGDFAQAAADKVWSTGTRTLTSFGTLVQDIWDKATSALTTVGSIGKLLVDNVNAAISGVPTANQNADALLDRTNGVETSWTVRQALRIMFSALGGKLDGAATTTVHTRDQADSKNRITATVDASGNRTAVTLDAS